MDQPVDEGGEVGVVVRPAPEPQGLHRRGGKPAQVLAVRGVGLHQVIEHRGLEDPGVVADGGEVDPAVRDDAGELGREAALGRDRITSYNVCYTKLLRSRRG